MPGVARKQTPVLSGRRFSEEQVRLLDARMKQDGALYRSEQKAIVETAMHLLHENFALRAAIEKEKNGDRRTR